MTGSGVWAGTLSLQQAYGIVEVGGRGATLKSGLERIGYLGAVQASYEGMPMAAHFELHIEQGPVLEAQKQKVGVVTGVQGCRWYNIEIGGTCKSDMFLRD